MPPPCQLLIVQRAADGKTRFVQDVGINHRGGNVFCGRGVPAQYGYRGRFPSRGRREEPSELRRKKTPNAQRPTSNADYAGAPPRAPGSGGVTSGAATTCLGGFSAGIFLPGGGETPGGGLIRRPCSTISLSCEPSSVSNSSSAFAIASSLSRFAVSVVLAS